MPAITRRMPRPLPLPLLMTLMALVASGPALAVDEPWVADARTVASVVPAKLLTVLTEAISSSGTEGAIATCRDKAPQMAKAASEQSGWQIRRVSLRNRNAKAVPDAWEQAALTDFDRRAAAGESPSTLERAEAVTDTLGHVTWRYMRALPTQPMCTACHGTSDKLSPEVVTRLREFYPDDRATGYLPGQIRGAITLTRSAP